MQKFVKSESCHEFFQALKEYAKKTMKLEAFVPKQVCCLASCGDDVENFDEAWFLGVVVALYQSETMSFAANDFTNSAEMEKSF